MKNVEETKKYIIDAEGKTLGRLASKAASILIGKESTSFVKNDTAKVKVEIINTSKANINEKKKLEVEYPKYSGYPGGLRFETIAYVIEKKGYGEVFRRAVYGMIPNNKLRVRIMKNLTVTE